jgi:hypothetical protein
MAWVAESMSGLGENMDQLDVVLEALQQYVDNCEGYEGEYAKQIAIAQGLIDQIVARKCAEIDRKDDAWPCENWV